MAQAVQGNVEALRDEVIPDDAIEMTDDQATSYDIQVPRGNWPQSQVISPVESDTGDDDRAEIQPGRGRPGPEVSPDRSKDPVCSYDTTGEERGVA